MSLTLRKSFGSPVKLEDCKGSRIYCHCVFYLSHSRSPSSHLPTAEACLDMSDAVHCCPLRPDLKFLLSPMPLSLIPEEDNDFMDRDSNEKKVIATETPVKDVPETGTSRTVSPPKIRFPRHHQSPVQIEACYASNPLRNAGMAEVANAAENSYGHGVLQSDALTDGSRHDFEHSSAEGAVQDDSTTALFERVDGWMHAMEQSEKQAYDMARETAELKNRLERLLNEIVTTRNQICPHTTTTTTTTTPTTPRFTHSSRPNAVAAAHPSQHSVLALGRNSKLQKDSCCENQSLSEYVASTNEDDNYERCASLFSMSREADGSCTSHEDAFSSEIVTDLSDNEMNFEEDIETVLQSIQSTTSLDETNKKVISFHPQPDSDSLASHSDLDFIPEALKSAYDMDTVSCCSDAEEAMECEDRNDEEDRQMQLSGKTRSTSTLCNNTNKRETNQRHHQLFEEPMAVWQAQDTDISVMKEQDGISSTTMRTKEVPNECIHEPAVVSCQSQNCCYVAVQTRNNAKTASDDCYEIPVVALCEKESEEEMCSKEKETSKLDLGCLEMHRCGGIIDPTPRDYLGKNRMHSTAKGWSSNSLEIFQEERSMDDATLLAECEKHLNSSKRSNAFRFMPWWPSMKKPYNLQTSDPTNGGSPFGSEDNTPKDVKEFSKQCQKWSRIADRKRSFFGFFMPSLR